MIHMNNIKWGFCLSVMCLAMLLYGCGSNGTATQSDSSVATEAQQKDVSEPEEVVIDYGDAESFEAALNEGKNLEGKVVRFTAREIHPNSAIGFNVWAGEHLNFVSSRNPDIEVNDTVTVRTTTIESISGSWIINYEKVDHAVTDENTINVSQSKEQEQPETAATNESTAAKPDANESSQAEPNANQSTPTAADESNKEAAQAESAAESTAASGNDAEQTENTYEHNAYFDVVEAASYRDSIGTTHVIHKVLAKSNVTISATLLAYGTDGNVLGKGTDEIILTEGKYNYFHYLFDSDISNASFRINATPKNDTFMIGERNAVEMVQYDISGDSLYVTLQQTGDSLGAFSQFKLLLYKGDTIVDTEENYFNISAQSLNGKGSTDVAEIWVYGVDFDRVEYVYEP
jgi:hypothetical protein